MITNNYVNRVCELVSRISENGGRGHLWFLINFEKTNVFFFFLKLFSRIVLKNMNQIYP